MDAHVASLGRNTSLSCNNGGSDWSTPYDQCDYGLGELMIGSATPQTLEAIFTTMPPVGKMQVMTSELTDLATPAAHAAMHPVFWTREIYCTLICIVPVFQP
jgi:hypothetical protein